MGAARSRLSGTCSRVAEDRREALLRYILRPAVAQERVKRGPDGLVRVGAGCPSAHACKCARFTYALASVEGGETDRGHTPAWRHLENALGSPTRDTGEVIRHLARLGRGSRPRRSSIDTAGGDTSETTPKAYSIRGRGGRGDFDRLRGSLSTQPALVEEALDPLGASNHGDSDSVAEALELDGEAKRLPHIRGTAARATPHPLRHRRATSADVALPVRLDEPLFGHDEVALVCTSCERADANGRKKMENSAHR